MKKILALLLTTILLLPGCGWLNKKSNKTTKKHQKVALANIVDIPVADEEMKSYFDDDVNEFVLEDDFEYNPNFETAENLDIDDFEKTAENQFDDDFFWIEDIDEEVDSFKNVYFEFDKSDLNNDQEEYVSHNINVAKSLVAAGETPVIIIEGHACSASGSRPYNLAISNSRAEKVSKRFIENGISKDSLKIVGRGQDVHVLDENGNQITGNKNEQWPNRRVEIKVYKS